MSDRVNILGVGATPQDLNSAVTTLDRWRAERRQEYVCVVSVHGLVVAQRDPMIRDALNHCGMATEDGMPLVWWSRLAGFPRARRVCGSDLLDEVCAFGLPRKFRHYFYGASPKVVEQLIDRLQKRYPGLCVAGYRSPPFRPLTPAEDAADIAAINEVEPDFVWVGLGMPKQENWMVEHLGKINATALIGVGAAFDFHAGTKPRAPVWMQHAGLEWLFRPLTEPRRLAHRYLIVDKSRKIPCDVGDRFVGQVLRPASRALTICGAAQIRTSASQIVAMNNASGMTNDPLAGHPTKPVLQPVRM